MLLRGKPSINRPFSMAMLNNQRVYSRQYLYWVTINMLRYSRHQEQWPSNKTTMTSHVHPHNIYIVI